MSKPYTGAWLFRTLLFTPGHQKELILKSATSRADCVVLDLEDAVPREEKGKAREIIREVLDGGVFSRKPVLVRVNPMDTGLTLVDVDAVACRHLDGFVFPKPYVADEIKAFDAQLSLKEIVLGLPRHHFALVVLIETAQAALRALEMATASKRIVGLLFGCEDYLADLQGMHSAGALSLLTPRSMVAMAARAAGIAPIDTPFVQLHDEAGFELHLQQGLELGFEGLLVMSPRQIDAAAKTYSPSPSRVEEARKMVKLAEQAERENRGIAIYNGRFISPPTLKQAQAVLDRHSRIQTFLEHCE